MMVYKPRLRRGSSDVTHSLPGTPTARSGRLLGVLLTCLAGCERGHAEAPSGTAAPLPLRDVRVLLGNDIPRMRLRCPRPLIVTDDSNQPQGSVPATESILVEPDGAGGLRLGERSIRASRILLRGGEGSPISLALEREGEWSVELTYPGALHLRPLDAGLMELINEVDLEHYVGCVVANEVWPTFETEAFRGQAIVTRTFVLYQMTRRPDAAYDVLATQGSQVYRGVREDAVGQKAAQAAEYTRGIVLTFSDRGEDRLFCTYFSAACGGESQSAKLLGPEGDVPPLQGGVRCDYCEIAPGDAYRWGPVRLALEDVTSRLLARYPEMESLGPLVSIAASEKTSTGRVVSLRLTGATGQTHDMLAERFRLAVGANLLRSTDCTIRTVGSDVIFENGKGFGHGLGLCQWGMQGQALSGRQAAEILRFYYPGAKLTRAY